MGSRLNFQGLKVKKNSLKNKNNRSKLQFSFKNFPYLGVLATKNVDFICLESRCSNADSENANQNIEEKEGIIK